MKVLVCGGRDFGDYYKVAATLDLLHRESPISDLIHGVAMGADSLAGRWARENNVAVREVPPQWELHGHAAGPRRNRQMLVEGEPDLFLALQGGRGTALMVQLAREAGVPVIAPDGTREQVIPSHWARAAATTDNPPLAWQEKDVQGQVIHYAPGENPLCGDEDPAALCNDRPERVAGCEYCLTRVREDLTDDHSYQGTCLHCRGKITAQGGIAWSRAVRSPCPHCARAEW